MFGTSGVRGVVGDEITAELALSIGRALGSEGVERVVVGRDPRESGRMLEDALTAGLVECGSDVVSLGVAATPSVGRAVEWLDADAGVSITASHNPAGENGIKLWDSTGKAFGADDREAITRRVETDDFTLEPEHRLGRTSEDDIFDRHVEALVGAVDIDAPPKVVVDVGNGAGGVTAAALSALGCSVRTLNAQPDGRFPGRPSEPTAETCRDLRKLVDATDADLGVAHDGDADRMMAVAEDGEFVGGDVLLALFARQVAGEGDRVAAPLNTSLAVDDYLAGVGATVTRTRVGDVYVAERATEPDVVFGGEPSGAWIWPAETLCPDGPLAACRLVELVSAHGRLSELVDDIDQYPIRRSSVEVADRGRVMSAVQAAVADAHAEVETVDGVRVDLGDGWFLVRASGTQPLVRVTAEAREAARADEIFAHAREFVETATADEERPVKT